MAFNIATYNTRISPIHRVDARVKILLVFVYSVALFCVHSWAGIALLAFFGLVCAAIAHLPLRSTLHTLLPLGFILLVTLLANSFVLDVRSYNPVAIPGAVSSGIFASAPAIPLVGAFGFAPAGFVRGCYYVLRIVLLVAASLVLTTTSSSTQITQALASFLRPLKHFGVPTHDIATVVSIALRFIPVSIDEFHALRLAQTSRGANFNTGSLLARLKPWATVLVPLFVGLYRRADTLALAMDARCYGASGQATQLSRTSFTIFQVAILAIGLLFCVAVAIRF